MTGAEEQQSTMMWLGEKRESQGESKREVSLTSAKFKTKMKSILVDLFQSYPGWFNILCYIICSMGLGTVGFV